MFRLVLNDVSSYYRQRGPLRESRVTALVFFLILGTLNAGGWSTPRPGRLYPRKDPVPVVQESGWASKLVWIGAENLAPPGSDPRTFQPVASRCTD